MKGRPLPGAVERPFGAPDRLTPDEFADLVLRPADDRESPPPREDTDGRA